MDPALTVGYLVLFSGAAVAVVIGGLFLGRLVRPHHPTPEKLQTYECGEPAVGPADVQFDLRFYVVALVFLIFDVEVAVFFPWAVVFGKATHLQSTAASEAGLATRLAELGFVVTGGDPHSGATGRPIRPEAALSSSTLESPGNARLADVPNVREHLSSVNSGARQAIRRFGRDLAWMAFIDVLVFFAILLVGFAYLWHRGDLAWIRALPEESRALNAELGILKQGTHSI